eukprot:g8476.t1
MAAQQLIQHDEELPLPVVRRVFEDFENYYNAGNYEATARCYADVCEIHVNGGVANGGPFSGTAPAEFAGFLKYMREEMGAEDMKFVVTGIQGNVHTDIWSTTKGTGACKAVWEKHPNGEWKIVKDEISFTPFDAVSNPQLDRATVDQVFKNFEDAYNVGDYAKVVECYNATTEIHVNGGVANGGPFSGTTPAEFAGFLKYMREEMGAEDMKFVVTGIQGNVHTDTWSTTKGTGACKAVWEKQPNGEWKIVKDEISFTPYKCNDAGSSKPQELHCGVASTIEFYSNKGHEKDAEAFLEVAKNAVQQTEPGTKLWYGVKFHAMDALGQKEEVDRFGIIDFFVDDAAQDAHFAGEVPKAVKANDETESPIVKGGLNAIVESAKAWDLLFAPKTTTKEKMESAKFVGYLPILAGEGQEENMKGLLKAGLGLVTEKEEKTSFWAAVQNKSNKREFAIIDTFDSMEGVVEHFVAPAAVPTAVQGVLAENPELIVGGWEEGVLKNVRIMEIVAKKIDLA